MTTTAQHDDVTRAPNPALRGSYPGINAPAQTATMPTSGHQNGRNLDGDKERIATLTLVGVRDGAPVELAQARFWMARRSDGASPVYCSVWTYGPRRDGTAGHGIARGYGYHKQSAALQGALAHAGIILAEPIDGRGDGAMRDALLAVGVAMGYDAAALAVMS